MGVTNSRLLVVTDLDGTLLNDAYRWDAAQSSVDRLKELDFPLVLNSSKTLAELSDIAENLGTGAPVVAENGGVIAVPEGCGLDCEGPTGEQVDGYRVEFLGLDRAEILRVSHSLRAERGFKFQGFADWSVSKIAALTGLSEVEAELASRRLATEPILWEDNEIRWDEFISSIKPLNIRAIRGGRFVHLMGEADKAKAMLELMRRYQRCMPDTNWTLVALGDSPNDLEMLAAADIAVVVPDASGNTLKPCAPSVVKASVPGPAGWHEAMTQILTDYL